MNSPGANQRITDANNAAAAAASKASEAAAKATEAAASMAEAKTASSTLVSDVNDLKLGSETLKGRGAGHPEENYLCRVAVHDSLQGVNLTPGGFHRSSDGFPPARYQQRHQHAI